MRSDLIRFAFATCNIWFYNGWLDSGAMFVLTRHHLTYNCVFVFVQLRICVFVMVGWMLVPCLLSHFLT